MHRWLLLVLTCGCLAHAHGQGDSLLRVWQDDSEPDSARLKAVQILAWKMVFEQPDSGMALARGQLRLAQRARSQPAEYEAHTTLAVGSSMRSDYSAALEHLRRCLALAKAMRDPKREANAYRNMSNVYRSLGDLPMALTQLQRSLRIDTELGNKEGLAGTYNNMGTIQTELNNHHEALEQYRKSATLAEELDSDRGRAQAALNLGSAYLSLGEPDTAAMLFERGLGLYRRMGRKLEQGMAFNNLGRAYGMLGREREGFAALDSAERILSEMGSMKQLVRTYWNKGNLYLERLDGRAAISACRTGERLAAENGLLQQRVECLQCLHQAYHLMGDDKQAYRAQTEFMLVEDSLRRLNNGKEVTRMEVTRVFQERMLADSLANERRMHEQELQAQEQVAAQREQRNMVLFAGLGALLLAGGLWNRLRYTRRSRAAIQREQQRSEGLLLNILPKPIAEELKEKGEAEARTLDQVTVIFTDFKGFTSMAERLGPKELVKDIHECFSAFDRICERHGVEKIKTIGDAYMAAAGLPTPSTTHALDAVSAALEMRDFIVQGMEQRKAKGLPYFEIRIGVHTGPVVAGIVGLRKFQYDIWGDTVNIASRMESSGEPGRVNISEATHSLLVVSSQLSGPKAQSSPSLSTDNQQLTTEFTFTPRGMVKAKGKGEMEMWFVELAPG
ncbi:MAG: tetratricopeptide repeat protein [Flavobacteriales bacterium]|nr:tetratricopeptide repeat protein [Flavobacteriales bacterium]